MLMVIVVITFLSLIGGMVFVGVSMAKKTSSNHQDNSAKKDIDTAQEFLPFKAIDYDVIDLGGHKYRAIVEVSSINYDLRTADEARNIEYSFRGFLNSLTFPISIFNQTKLIDLDKVVKKSREDISENCGDFGDLKEYSQIYLEELQKLPDEIGNNKEKKKYIIVPFDEAIFMSELNDEEKFDYALEGLEERIGIVLDGIAGFGASGRRLHTGEIAELIYSTYHKDKKSQMEGILKGEFNSLVVKGKTSEKSEAELLDWILYQTQSQLDTRISHSSANREYAEQLVKALEKEREKIQNERSQ